MVETWTLTTSAETEKRWELPIYVGEDSRPLFDDLRPTGPPDRDAPWCEWQAYLRARWAYQDACADHFNRRFVYHFNRALRAP
jgi:hypothetical protein